MLTVNEPQALEAIIKEKEMALVHFSNERCNVCLAIYEDLIQLETQHDMLEVIHVDMTENLEFTGLYSIFVHPTLVLYVMGKETKRYERLFSFVEIEADLERYEDLLS